MFLKKILSLLILTINYGPSVTSHPCRRECNGHRMVCEYHFKLETFYSLDIRACFNCPRNVTDCFRPDCILGGGLKRTVLSINRSLPGPAIEVTHMPIDGKSSDGKIYQKNGKFQLCQNDIVMVTVENQLVDAATSIHWHGQHMQRTPYMDGVPWVTQCPILPHTNFTYTFVAAQHGTHFYHSHDHSQRGDGLFGSLIVRVPHAEDPNADLYDKDLFDHTVVISDWNTRSKSRVFGDLLYNGTFDNPEGLIVNGLGPMDMSDHRIPLATFTVKRGKRYRFRFISASFFDCPIAVSIDSHNLTVLSSDGFDLEPQTVSSFIIQNGERYDFILNANQEIDVYWMRFKALKTCSNYFIHQLALLHYKGSSEALPKISRPSYKDAVINGSLILNGEYKGIKVSELNSLEPYDFNEISDPNIKPIYLQVNFVDVPNPVAYHSPYYTPENMPKAFKVFTTSINNIVYKNPSKPLLPNKEHFENGHHFCSMQTMKDRNCTSEFCDCTHVIELPLNEVVELIVFNGGNKSLEHPMHLHGAAFHVIAWENVAGRITKEELQELDRRGLIKRNFDYPPVKDTLSIITGGYAVLRFKAENPGYWLFHCHLDFHSEFGMNLVFKVGNSDDMEDVPANFPKCGSFPIR